MVVKVHTGLKYHGPVVRFCVSGDAASGSYFNLGSFNNAFNCKIYSIVSNDRMIREY